MEIDPINPEIQYEYFGEPSPVAAWGTYRGLTFDFRARWDEWRFVLSTDPEVEAGIFADEIDTERAFLEQGEHRLSDQILHALDSAFVRHGTYGEPKSWSASYMPRQDCMTIIRNCVAQYEFETLSR